MNVHRSGLWDPKFGVELEFLGAYLRPGLMDPHPRDPRKLDKWVDTQTDGLPGNERNHALKYLRKRLVRRLIHASRQGLDSIGSNTRVDETVERPNLKAEKVVGGVYEVYRKWGFYVDRCFDWNDDCRLAPICNPEYYFEGFEGKSPVYDGLETLEDELKAVLGAIKGRIRVSVNASNNIPGKWQNMTKIDSELPHTTNIVGEARPGVHIHISHPGLGTILSLKKLLTLFYICEPLIQLLHASWRSNDPRYCGLLTKHSRLARLAGCHVDEHYLAGEEADGSQSKQHTQFTDTDFTLTKENRNEMEEWVHASAHSPCPVCAEEDDTIQRNAIHIIWSAATMEQLVWLASSSFGNRRGAACLHNLLPDESNFRGGGVKGPGQRLGTVEFRYMQGSLDAENIVAWAKVLNKMTESCVVGSKAMFRCLHGSLNPFHTAAEPVTDFLTKLGFGMGNIPVEYFNARTQERLDWEADPMRAGPFLERNSNKKRGKKEKLSHEKAV